jgi:hypothetical protein
MSSFQLDNMLVITPPLQQSKNNLPQPSSLLLHVTYSPLVFFELSQKFILLFFLPLVHLESVKVFQPLFFIFSFFLNSLASTVRTTLQYAALVTVTKRLISQQRAAFEQLEKRQGPDLAGRDGMIKHTKNAVNF